MADATYYAWSPISWAKKEKDKDGVEKVTDSGVVALGDTVTASGLGLTKEQFQALIDGGSVRKQKLPDMPDGYADSPVNRMRELALQAENAEDADLGWMNEMPQSSPSRSVAADGSAINSPAPPG